jgi:cleavage and polyadenylation specificity factor subunit 3
MWRLCSFHLDHAAALTYIMEKVYLPSCLCLAVLEYMAQTNFRDGKGKVYMTHPTKAVHKFMMQDYVRMR